MEAIIGEIRHDKHLQAYEVIDCETGSITYMSSDDVVISIKNGDDIKNIWVDDVYMFSKASSIYGYMHYSDLIRAGSTDPDSGIDTSETLSEYMLIRCDKDKYTFHNRRLNKVIRVDSDIAIELIEGNIIAPSSFSAKVENNAKINSIVSSNYVDEYGWTHIVNNCGASVFEINKNDGNHIAGMKLKGAKKLIVDGNVINVRAVNGSEYERMSLAPFSIEDNKHLERVILRDGVKIISNDAFNSFEELGEVEMTNSVGFIGKQAFEGCKKLKDIKSLRNIRYIADGAFRACNSLEQIELGDKLEGIGKYAFNMCENLKEIVIPSSVKQIFTGAFSECWSLERLIIPESVEYIGRQVFSRNSKLKEVKIPAKLEYTNIKVPDSTKIVRY